MRGSRIAILMILALSYSFMVGAAWGEWPGLFVIITLFTAGLAIVALLFGWLVSPWTTIEYRDKSTYRVATISSSRTFLVKKPDGGFYASLEESAGPRFLRRRVHRLVVTLSLGQEVEVWQ
jgi:hypothetical protein